MLHPLPYLRPVAHCHLSALEPACCLSVSWLALQPYILGVTNSYLWLIDVHFKEVWVRASLVAQWLRIRLPMQGTWVQALVWEDPTCCGATKPMRHNY